MCGPGRACQISQSSPRPQASALYSNGATMDAWPWRKASVMASWPQKPVIASASSNGRSARAMGNQLGSASRPAPTAMDSIMVRISDSLVSVRLARRPATAATA